MSEEKIEVDAYSGYKGEEIPRSLVLNNEKILVTQILRMWIEDEFGYRKRRRYFEIKGSNGFRYKIYFDEDIKEWFLFTR
ncbi:MAG: hypothetical protein HXY47_05865 [Nitrospirae bacterium]|nr:hypothetical protein [Nitrospirota bacterium]